MSAERFSGGYRVTIPGNRGNVYLRVYDSGVMADESGAPIVKSDVTLACISLPSEMHAKVWAWWLGYSRRTS